MTRSTLCCLIAAVSVLLARPVLAAEPELRTEPGEEQFVWRGGEKSPSLAAGLSLTPLPIDFGNFYAGSPSWGLVYSGAELAVAGTIVWWGTEHLCWFQAADCTYRTESAWVAGAMFTGYVAIKIRAAFHADAAARKYNRERLPELALMPAPDGGRAIVRWQF
jgi:hypothetical protein